MTPCFRSLCDALETAKVGADAPERKSCAVPVRLGSDAFSTAFVSLNLGTRFPETSLGEAGHLPPMRKAGEGSLSPESKRLERYFQAFDIFGGTA